MVLSCTHTTQQEQMLSDTKLLDIYNVSLLVHEGNFWVTSYECCFWAVMLLPVHMDFAKYGCFL